MDAKLPALSPEDRLTEVAHLLAAGLLRMKTSAGTADIGPPGAPGESPDPRQKALDCRAAVSPHPPAV